MSGSDYDLIVVGAGPGGYIAALTAAQKGLKTACIEKDASLGGTCLNVGCIPSKTLLYATELYNTLKQRGALLGIKGSGLSCDFGQMMQHKEETVAALAGSVAAQLKAHGVEVIHSEARFSSPTTLTLSNGSEVSAKNFILATGSVPIALPFLPFDEETILSSTGALALKEPPKRLTVVGAGVIGVELASVYSRLGSEVTLVEALGSICFGLDELLCKTLHKALVKQGLRFLLNTTVTEAAGSSLKLSSGEMLEGEKVLVSIGRRPNSASLNLEAAGVATTKQGFVAIDNNFASSQPHIYAIGDLTPGPMLAHRANEDGVAAATHLAGGTFHVNYATIPNVVYTHPEVASSGLTEQEAASYKLTPLVGLSYFRGNSRARCMAESEGVVKVVADKESRRLLGVHIVGPHASEMIAEAVVAIDLGATVDQLAATAHPHPTLSEAVKEAAIAAAKGKG